MARVHIQPNSRRTRTLFNEVSDKEVNVRSLKAAFQPAVDPAKIFIPAFKVGQRVLVNDQKTVIEATLYSISVPYRYEVIDDQGFIHMTQALETPDEYGAALRCIVMPTNKVSAGYNPKGLGRNLQ